jgi:hypothetical protein
MTETFGAFINQALLVNTILQVSFKCLDSADGFNVKREAILLAHLTVEKVR